MVVRDIARALHFLHNKGGWGHRPARVWVPPGGEPVPLWGGAPWHGGGAQPFPALGSGWGGGVFWPYMRALLFVNAPPDP